jgi:hypothetical protein
MLPGHVRLSLSLTRADLESLVASFLPLHVRLAGEGERYFALGAARSFEVVPGVGLRIETTGQIRWEALGIALPLTVRTIQAMARPHVPPGQTKLAFAIVIEQADFVGVPGFVDHTIVERANDALSRANLAWDFGKTLGRSLPLPPTLTPVSRVDLRVDGGEAALTAEGLSLTIDMAAAIARDRSEGA